MIKNAFLSWLMMDKTFGKSNIFCIKIVMIDILKDGVLAL